MLGSVRRELRKRVGIIGGSGPDAGIDLMAKVVRANRAFLGKGVGDKDAPAMTLMNVPTIGGPHGSWDLTKGTPEYESLLESMKSAAREISSVADYFCIACNTLHKVQPDLEQFLAEEKLDCEFISIIDTVADYCRDNGVKSLAVMGSKMTTDIKNSSPYAVLGSKVNLVQLPVGVRDSQQSLLELVKSRGPTDLEANKLYQTIIDSFDADHVLLGCTEFPLLKADTKKQLIDPTQLLAERLVQVTWDVDKSS